MKIGFLITARMKSTRLPLKLMLKVEEREIISWMIDRLKLSKRLNNIIICTSTNKQDDILADIAREEDIDIFRGNENDVIQRLFEASKQFNLDYALNITADCPLVSFEYIGKIIDKYIETDADLIRTLDLPHGFFSYGLKVKALAKICEIKNDTETEVWGRYFTDTGIFNVVDLIIPKELIRRDYRLTLDYPEDYEFFKAIYKKYGKNTYKTKTQTIIQFLDQNPQIVEINRNLKQAYEKRWETQNKLMLK